MIRIFAILFLVVGCGSFKGERGDTGTDGVSKIIKIVTCIGSIDSVAYGMSISTFSSGDVFVKGLISDGASASSDVRMLPANSADAVKPAIVIIRDFETTHASNSWYMSFDPTSLTVKVAYSGEAFGGVKKWDRPASECTTVNY